MRNEFEKQVQEKMETLDVSPSAPVWLHVKKEISANRRRRRFFFLVFIGLVLLSGGAYFYFDNSHSISYTASHPSQYEKVSKQRIQTEPDKIEASPERKTETGTEKVFSDDKTIVEKRNKIVAKKSNQPISKSTGVLPHTSEFKNETLLSETESGQNTAPPEMKGNIKPKEQTNEILHATAEKKSKDSTQVVKINPPVSSARNDSAEGQKQDSILTVPVVQALISDSSQILVQQTPANTWQWSLQAAAGVSKWASGIGVFEKSLADYLASPGNNTGGGSNALPPAPESGGLALTAGVQLSRPLSPHLRLTTGLQYKTYGTHLKTATAVQGDTSISYFSGQVRLSQYYPNAQGANQDYQNRFHFISLPVSLQYQVSEKLPLIFDLGLSAQQLLATNALIYHPQGQFYFRDKNAFHQTQFFATAGVGGTFFRRLQAGFYMDYGFTPAQKEVNSNRRLSASGLRLNYFLKK